MKALLLALLPSLAFAADPGDVVFTELLIDSGAGSTAEWIELKNTTGDEQVLDGCTLESVDEGNGFALDGVAIAAGEYAVLVRGQTCAVFDDDGAKETPTIFFPGIRSGTRA